MDKYIIDYDQCLEFQDQYNLYRIRAMRDFSDVKAGDLGGWVMCEDNLSQEGNCWIYDNAIVFQSAFIFDDAEIRNDAIVGGFSIVSGDSVINEEAIIGMFAVLNGQYVGGQSIVLSWTKNTHYEDVALYNDFVIAANEEGL